MKNLEHSKKLSYIMTTLFIFVVVGAMVAKVFGIDMSAIINPVLIAETIVLGYYFGKAGVENVAKIKQADNEGSEL